MSEHLIGAVVERSPGPRYFESLRFAEIAPRRPLPKASVFAKWRAGAPEQARFTLRPPPETWRGTAGPFRDAPNKSEGAQWMARAHDALAADAIVLVTGTDLTPGPRDRERLATWAGHLAGGGKRRIVWQPGGLWDIDEAATFANSLGVVCAFDPLESPAPTGEIAYARVRAIGARSRLGEGLLSAIVESIAASDAATIYLAIESELGFKKARRVSELLADLREESGGTGVLRRGGGGIVIDLGDEEEDEEDEELDEDEEDEEDEELDEDEEADEDEDLDDEGDEDLDDEDDEDDEDEDE
ncbi:hypothetical protein [Sandaracinus amylolyticus]|uniref:hypothetical protein n=1 Tax=Sandaracinus amylolyticus TaxID=927083 RepID=UPI001F357799|nr:hypothetical protein [Sandaracinus amylolyticus]UJR81779.1 Hypothetical protein I5071_38390 [Sandaracinus amylolyticus]